MIWPTSASTSQLSSFFSNPLSSDLFLDQFLPFILQWNYQDSCRIHQGVPKWEREVFSKHSLLACTLQWWGLRNHWGVRGSARSSSLCKIHCDHRASGYLCIAHPHNKWCKLLLMHLAYKRSMYKFLTYICRFSWWFDPIDRWTNLFESSRHSKSIPSQAKYSHFLTNR